jgi:hypothetical protein
MCGIALKKIAEEMDGASGELKVWIGFIVGQHFNF